MPPLECVQSLRGCCSAASKQAGAKFIASGRSSKGIIIEKTLYVGGYHYHTASISQIWNLSRGGTSS